MSSSHGFNGNGLSSSLQNIRALALDLDGTLLDPKGRLSPEAVRILRALAAKGINIILASGRMTARVIPYAEQVGVALTLVSYNGAETSEGQGSVWSRTAFSPLDSDSRETIFRLCRDEAVFLNVYSDGALYGYHPQGDFESSNFYSAQTGATYQAFFRDLDQLPREAIAKLLMIQAPENRDALYAAWSMKLTGKCALTKSNPEYVEVLSNGVSKGRALAEWLKRRSLDANQLLAFGDAENDLDMLRLAGIGYAMRNATPGLLRAFPKTTRLGNTQNGLARELDSLFGIGIFDDPNSMATSIGS